MESCPLLNHKTLTVRRPRSGERGGYSALATIELKLSGGGGRGEEARACGVVSFPEGVNCRLQIVAFFFFFFFSTPK